MLKSNVPSKERRADWADSESLKRRLLRVFRAAKLLAMSADPVGNRMFREGGAGDLMFLRQAVEEADPWVRKEAGK